MDGPSNCTADQYCLSIQTSFLSNMQPKSHIRHCSGVSDIRFQGFTSRCNESKLFRDLMPYTISGRIHWTRLAVSEIHPEGSAEEGAVRAKEVLFRAMYMCIYIHHHI